MQASGVLGFHDDGLSNIGGLRKAIAHFNQIMGTPRPLEASFKKPFLQCEKCQWRGFDLSVSVCAKCGSTHLSEMSHVDLNDCGPSNEFPLCSG